MDILTIVLGILIAALIWCYKHLHRYRGHLEKLGIPVIKAYPIIGSSPYLIHNTSVKDFDRMCMEKYGDNWGSYVGYKAKIFSVDYELIKELMIKKFNCFTDREIMFILPDKVSIILHFYT